MRARFFISIVVLSTLATAAWAGEHVTLRNGYEMHCDHRADVEGHVRLFLSAGEDNFIEFAPEEIATVEHVADPPPENRRGTSEKAAMVRPEPANDAKLSPADLHEILAKAGGDHNLDADLLASLVKAESGGNARAVSRAGARGLMQLMPEQPTNWVWETASSPTKMCAAAPPIWTRCWSTTTTTWPWRWRHTTPARLRSTSTTVSPLPETRTYVAYVIHEFNRRVLARQALARQTIASSATSQDKGTR